MAATNGVDDFTFLMTCLVNLTNEFPKPDYEKVAAQIGAKSASACYHRLWHMKKNWGLTNSSSGSGSGGSGKKGKGGDAGATATATKTKAGRKPKPKPSTTTTAAATAATATTSGGGVKRGRPKKLSLSDIVNSDDDNDGYQHLLGNLAKKPKVEEGGGSDDDGDDHDVVVNDKNAMTPCIAH